MPLFLGRKRPKEGTAADVRPFWPKGEFDSELLMGYGRRGIDELTIPVLKALEAVYLDLIRVSLVSVTTRRYRSNLRRWLGRFVRDHLYQLGTEKNIDKVVIRNYYIPAFLVIFKNFEEVFKETHGDVERLREGLSIESREAISTPLDQKFLLNKRPYFQRWPESFETLFDVYHRRGSFVRLVLLAKGSDAETFVPARERINRERFSGLCEELGIGSEIIGNFYVPCYQGLMNASSDLQNAVRKDPEILGAFVSQAKEMIKGLEMGNA